MVESAYDRIRANFHRSLQPDCTDAEREALAAESQALADAETERLAADKPGHSDAGKTIQGCISALFVVVMIAYVLWRSPTVIWYAMEYHVPTGRVYIDPKPSDCDFWHAPIGFKGCHYEKLALRQSDPIGLYVSWVKKSD